MSKSGSKLVLAIIGLVALVYVVSPMDLVPGPVDDAIVIICCLSSLLSRSKA